MHTAVRPVSHRQPASRDDAGFSLIEVIVALGLIVFVMAATTGFFIRSLHSADSYQQRQSAVALADQAMERWRAVPANNLLQGRDQAGVNAQWASPGGVDLSQSVKVWGCTSGCPTVLVPFTQSATVDKVPYTVRNFVNACYLPQAGGTCGTNNSSTATQLYRVSVDVQWKAAGGQHCAGPGGQCEYVVTTLRDPSADPVFNTNTGP